MDLVDADLIAEFAVESREGLANIENQMLAIEECGDAINLDLVNAVFRTMHSIKGAAGFLGLDNIGTLAHGLEEVLNRLRNTELIPTSELVTSVLTASDFMKSLIDAVETSNDVDIGAPLAILQQFRKSTVSSTNDEPSSALPDPAAAGIETAAESKSDPVKCTASLPDAVREFLTECGENLDQMERDLVSLEQEPKSEPLQRSIFRAMHTLKGGAGFLGLSCLEQLAHAAENLLAKLREARLTFNSEIAGILLDTIDKCREGLKIVESFGNEQGFVPGAIMKRLQSYEENSHSRDCQIKQTSNRQNLQLSPKELLPTQIASPVQNTQPTPTRQPAELSPLSEAANDKPTPTTGESTIRVDVALLDSLMTRVGELVLARNQIVKRAGLLNDPEYVGSAQRLNQITSELQEGVMKTRMQPIGNVWSKFPRLVRDLAAQLGKLVRIEMTGIETDLDKTILEAIKDPLTHLVRNSIDHGIEQPVVRAVAGKPAEGTLQLKAYHEGGQVNIEIVDDGAGLNLDRIRKKAVEKALLTADQAARLSDRDASQLIFAPGFSTAEQVTSVSGRGVGMDVVKTNIERIGGTIDLQSRSGEGTTVRIKIPLTLAIIPALIVANEGSRYAIPQASLLELVRLNAGKAENGIEFLHGAPVYRLRGKLLPLIYLSKCLRRTEDPNEPKGNNLPGNKSINIVVLRVDDRQFGLIVDKVNDTEEIVVKPLGKQLKGIREYAGATIMGDGSVALILDVKGLSQAAGIVGDESLPAGAANQDNAADRNSAKQAMLIVDIGDERRFGLPTSQVARLERIYATSIEQSGQHEVIQYRGTILPLVRLSNIIGGSVTDNLNNELRVVVYDDSKRRIGLVVRRILDVCDVDQAALDLTRTNDYILGTLVIHERVTDLLDLRRLADYGLGNQSMCLKQEPAK